ncbi:hypothetical protein [Paenibacillus herberti]|uniref:Methyl-accepting chemotaxis protein n=1 Tax=Paenibacillus herberti TaxID=1619309 RepID=A0A229P0C1_9BACL|nr:hypothetical protein [Paenibacillus herberti]OXM15547.1 hypothetical protein CGZ75_02070 [Paenibacillus herberti]
MENIASFLKMTISLLITLAVITAGLFLWNKAQVVVELTNAQAISQAKELNEQQYAAFDNQLVSGSQILTAYRRYAGHSEFFLYVNAGVSKQFGMVPGGDSSRCRNFNYWGGTLEDGTNSNCGVTEEDISDAGDSRYIPPQSRYRSQLVRDANDRVTAVFFDAE